MIYVEKIRSKPYLIYAVLYLYLDRVRVSLTAESRDIPDPTDTNTGFTQVSPVLTAAPSISPSTELNM